MYIRAGAALVAISLAFAFLACGDDDDDDDSGSTVAASEAVAQADALCETYVGTFDDRGEFPVDDFDPENPDPADLPAVGDFLEPGIATEQQLIADLQALDASDQQAELDAMIVAFEAELDGLETQVEAAHASDVDAFVATVEQVAPLEQARKEAATEFGATECAF